MIRQEEVRLKPVERTRLSDVAVQQIRDLIFSGQLKSGDQLPPERDLVEQLGVSRSSVREALRTLQGMGLLEVKPGSGAFVSADLGESKVISLWMTWLLEHEHAVLDLLEAREALETRAAILAAERITDEELEHLDRLVVEMELCAERGEIQKLVACDREFHDQICRASRNQFITTLNASLYAALDEVRTSVFTLLPTMRSALIAEHQAIYQALRSRNADRVWQTVSYHFDSFRNDIRQAIHPHGQQSVEDDTGL
ncbi:MAG: FadR/GntR family transcriptional regulator [Anaerolineae bacterium]